MAIELITDAIRVLNGDGFDTRSLRDNLERLNTIRQRARTAV
jgi:hypothetical protein